MKPIIGLMAHMDTEKGPFGHSHLGNTYILSISRAGGVPLMIPARLQEDERERLVPLCDGFLFTGGVDISPYFYGEDAHEKVGFTDSVLDEVQIPFMKMALAADKPILGICRGHQVLNVACGGTLYQDLSEIPGVYVKHFQKTRSGDVSHMVNLKPGSLLFTLYGEKIMVNSYHHQAVKKCGKNVKPVAYSADGVVEAIEVAGHSYAMGVQWHPEAMYAVGNPSMEPLFASFVEACARKRPLRC